MSQGVSIIRALLVAEPTVTSAIPPARIGAGMMPQGTALPWLSLSLVSSVDRNIPAPGAKRNVADRVQVTVAAAKYDDVATILAAVKTACADKRPASAIASEVAVLGLGRGPDFSDAAASIYLGNRDFQVTYNEVR